VFATRYVRSETLRIKVRVAPITHPQEADMSLYLPGAVWRPISYRADAGPFTTPPLGYIPHVPVSNGSLFAFFNGLVSPNRKFSTAWIAKDGHSEQYQSLDMKPWAQAAGNGQYHAFEVEGYPNEPYTAAQIETLAVWHNFLGTADIIVLAPGQRGIGTHYMGGLAWGGHTCPDPVAGAGPRSKQRAAIIARAIALRTPTPEDDMFTDTDRNILNTTYALLREQQLRNAPVVNAETTKVVAGIPAATAKAVVAALPAGGTPGVVDVAAIAKAVNDDAAKRLVS
jgi:hypothetical protein